VPQSPPDGELLGLTLSGVWQRALMLLVWLPHVSMLRDGRPPLFGQKRCERGLLRAARAELHGVLKLLDGLPFHGAR